MASVRPICALPVVPSHESRTELPRRWGSFVATETLTNRVAPRTASRLLRPGNMGQECALLRDNPRRVREATRHYLRGTRWWGWIQSVRWRMSVRRVLVGLWARHLAFQSVLPPPFYYDGPGYYDRGYGY